MIKSEDDVDDHAAPLPAFDEDNRGERTETARTRGILNSCLPAGVTRPFCFKQVLVKALVDIQ